MKSPQSVPPTYKALRAHWQLSRPVPASAPVLHRPPVFLPSPDRPALRKRSTLFVDLISQDCIQQEHTQLFLLHKASEVSHVNETLSLISEPNSSLVSEPNSPL